MNNTLRRLHQNFTAPRELLYDLVLRATDRKPIDSKKIVRGHENEVHSVTTERTTVYVRIRRNGEVPLAQEAWAIAQSRAAGIPVPEILMLETIEVDGEKLEAMVQEQAAGQALGEILLKLPTASADRALDQVGQLLGQLHAIPTEGSGHRQEDGTWEFQNWPQWLERETQRRSKTEPYLLQAGFSPADFAFMLAQLHTYPTIYPCKNTVFCHGDIEPAHIFIGADQCITGLIDFGQFQGNSPLQDFMHLSLFLSPPQLASVKNGYPHKFLLDPDFEHKLHLQRLVFLMGCVAHVTMKADKNVDKTPNALEQLQTTLATLRKYGE